MLSSGATRSITLAPTGTGFHPSASMGFGQACGSSIISATDICGLFAGMMAVKLSKLVWIAPPTLFRGAVLPPTY